MAVVTVEDAVLMMRFGDRVRGARGAKGLTQGQVAERAGMSRSYLCRVEQGKVNVSVVSVARVATAIGVDVDELVDRLWP